ncbi:uncharacterized protein PAC_19116 [Phialocephala subalpina]|uniref:Zn(2)-C6 fungal-type domain-containing protein n=1 Tax=Phialocephala subalpina TaxID=576137 RepID=A0A1L7XW12_9HELO|nr:uncharacterized protein PAC_19116 [Phialocephala subalpina]
MSTTVSAPRHRATLACDTCRSRRTKCDGRKPNCSFCEQHGILCNYRATLSSASKQDTEISTVREHLDQIYRLLSLRSTQFPSRLPGNPTGLPAAQLGEYPADESIISRTWRREFPFMTIQTPSMMCLLGLDPRLAAQLVALERTDVSNLTESEATPSNSLFEYHDAISAFESLCDKAHHWYPVLPPDFFEVYREQIVGDLPPSTETFIVLLIAAIGSIARCSSLAEAYVSRPDAKYIQNALSMLPKVHFEFSLKSVQCFVLLSIYYDRMAKPCQAHDYILIASCKAQALFKCHLYDDNPATMELLRRCFWSILLIETCELAYHIDMPESNIWKFDDRILLPSTFESWQPSRPDQRYITEELLSSQGTQMPPEAGKAYFLAEITMCRMHRRCTSSVTISHDLEVYAPIIAAELTHQMENWYGHLPTSIRFERQDTITHLFEELDRASTLQSYPPLTAATKFLQMQYFLCLTGIYWPAVYSVISTGALTDAPVADCARFFESYSSFVLSAATTLPCCPQRPWSVYASIFITTMAALRGARTPSLHPTISPYVLRCFAVAAKVFERGDAVTVSPSLRMIGSILREHVGTFIS